MMDYIVCSANEIFFIAVTKCNLHSASTRLDFADDTFFFLVRFTGAGWSVSLMSSSVVDEGEVKINLKAYDK